MAIVERSIVGDLINFRGMVYAPLNESGVLFLFGKVDLHRGLLLDDAIEMMAVGACWTGAGGRFGLKSAAHLACQCAITML